MQYPSGTYVSRCLFLRMLYPYVSNQNWNSVRIFNVYKIFTKFGMMKSRTTDIPEFRNYEY